MNTHPIVILISANLEWLPVREKFAAQPVETTPFGEWFETRQEGRSLIFMHGGWGKISAAATTQYAVDRWHPRAIINLGTCGGFAGQVERGEIILATHTLVYDILEQMGDPVQAIAHYTTALDLSWLPQPYPLPVRPCLIVSADRDIVPAEIPALRQRYNAVVADWESAAIAWVAARSGVRCLILRGVTDLVGEQGGEAYDGINFFQQSARQVMTRLLDSLPDWLDSKLD